MILGTGTVSRLERDALHGQWPNDYDEQQNNPPPTPPHPCLSLVALSRLKKLASLTRKAERAEKRLARQQVRLSVVLAERGIKVSIGITYQHGRIYKGPFG